ncbi:MAG: hypothetical protein R2939_20105 [Kofleriaceae bacterium]
MSPTNTTLPRSASVGALPSSTAAADTRGSPAPPSTSSRSDAERPSGTRRPATST